MPTCIYNYCCESISTNFFFTLLAWSEYNLIIRGIQRVYWMGERKTTHKIALQANNMKANFVLRLQQQQQQEKYQIYTYRILRIWHIKWIIKSAAYL